MIEAIFRLRETQGLRLNVGRGFQDVSLKQFGEDAILDSPPPSVSGDVRVRALGWQKDGADSFGKSSSPFLSLSPFYL